MITDDIRAVLAAKADALARRSADDIAALLHPDFVYVTAGGYKFDKAGYIENGCTSGRLVFRSQKVRELDVRQFGDAAVATMVLDDHFA
ncbi:MAG TPA: nuclear transport factor 2 family protein, partial [Reyranellaceae bacterium]|nr:nuclear transport factor 2 family protein [Reyranellaceae bacterium]